MARRTITNLSRELNVSRPRIYRAIERLGIKQKAGAEYPLNEWGLIKNELTNTACDNEAKKVDTLKVINAGTKGMKKSDVKIKDNVKISDMDISTIKERLKNAKQEYDYNRDLITMFQEESAAYFEKEGKTTMQTHNGTMSAIPSITSLEKYIKLNIQLSKLITDLEGDLDLSVEGGDDPFV